MDHAAVLLAQFDAAWSAAPVQQVVGVERRDGTYLEFRSSPAFELKLKSMEDLRTGMRLMNVRTAEREEGPVQLATVHVPDRAKAMLLGKLTAYAEEVTATGKPKNQSFVERIAEIQRVLVSSFWTETSSDRPPPGAARQWVEVWISSREDDEIGRFRNTLRALGIREHERKRILRFPERTVLVLHANGNELASLIEHSDQIAEFRAVHEPASPLENAQNREQTEWVRALLERSRYPQDDRVVVCVLDSGVNNGHALLSPLLDDADMHVFDAIWGVHDLQGHGTLTAGIAAYADLQNLLSNSQPVDLGHRLESSKMLRDAGSTPEKLYGAITEQAVYLPELQAPDRDRVFCMAVAAAETSDLGRPTSWSGKVDQLASGAEDDQRRLFIQAAGNVRDNADWKRYPASNFTKQVHDPAQAWNALTVGAYTQHVRITRPDHVDSAPLAEHGEISPYTTTSLVWEPKWPVKPEVMFEGGNLAIDSAGDVSDIEELQVISTHHQPTTSQFGYHNATSAASAQAAWMAARIHRAYPEAWPETVRALMVHSAEWTDAMMRQCKQGNGAVGMNNLLRSCGYGVPNLDKALHCLKDRLTLVSQAEIQPFADGSSNEMHLYALPWPTEALLDLEELRVRMRVTLSYFIEPGPGEIGWKDRYRYPSHGLRFALNSADESADEFQRRINSATWTEELDKPDTKSPKEWLIGPRTRDKGSIHSDIWEGRAADLATSNLIGIVPTIGWWRERKHLGKSNKRTRYSLVVSIETPEEEVNIYTPVAVKAGVPVEVIIPIRE